ncbi:MAG: hypothetical protein J7639_24810, partial [Paenibacillaceae bacterium]|nr:hypothetical protein [Paenibacillaceae bacterium]
VVPGSMTGFDFKAARDRQRGWASHYRFLKQTGQLTIEWEYEIRSIFEGIEREIAEAHATAAGKMKMTVRGDGHPIVHTGNVLTPIIPAWTAVDKENAQWTES